MSTQYLVITDIDAIQSYVFGSMRMATIVGASEQVRLSDEYLLKLGCQATVKVCHGGVGLFVFTEEGNAAVFKERAESEFCGKIGLTLTASSTLPFSSSDKDSFARIRDQALEEIDSKKRGGRSISEACGIGLAWVCETCGASVAAGMREHARTTWRMCDACLKRYEKRNDGEERQRNRYGRLAIQENRNPLSFARNFDKLCEDDYWALISLDGDGLGDRLRNIGTPEDFRSFSEHLHCWINGGLSHALRSVYRQCNRPEIAPVIVLFDGGDDIVVACQGQVAMEFVMAFSRFLQRNNANWNWCDGQPIGFSAGICIVRQGFPFRTAHKITDGLLRNAKRAARKRSWACGAVDYAIVTESYGDATAILHERGFESADGAAALNFTGRPYSLQMIDSENAFSCSIKQLKQAVRILHRADFPRSRLFDLRNNLTRSRWGREPSTASGIRDFYNDDVQPFLKHWRERTCRSFEEEWREVEGALAAAENINDRLPANIPVADLADAMYFWERANAD